MHTTVSSSPLMAGVSERACLSALIVNEMLTQIQYRQIFRGPAWRFHHGQICDSSGSAVFLYLPRQGVYPRSNLSGLDECGGAGSIPPLTDNQCDFNLNHMNRSLPRAEIKYI